MEKRVRRASFCMMNLQFGDRGATPMTVLCLGSHSDDIEIGCGGTLLQMANDGLTLKLCWVVMSAAGPREQEARQGCDLFARGCEKEFVVGGFRDGYLPYEGAKVKEFFEGLKAKVNPDLIFTHWEGDAHQDHRAVCELTWNTFRNHLIFEYEIPKYDGDLGRPNTYVALEESVAERKAICLLDAFGSQRDKHWFDAGLFRGLMRIRGMEAHAESGYAEGFYCRKTVVR
jgi:LmbE family N-acetylglucosaminyl deacetylase